MTYARTFDALRGEQADWCKSLAYWIGTYRGACELRAVTEIAGGMSLQYDSEEQADALGVAVADDLPWSPFFTPIAPVQVCRAWSPVPTAISLLGEPSVEHASEASILRTSVVAWDGLRSTTLATTANGSADEGRLVALLIEAASRARASACGLLLVAQPGWGYDVDDFSEETIRLMRAAGFVTTTRRP